MFHGFLLNFGFLRKISQNFHAKYHRLSHPRNLICTKYQEKYRKNENGWRSVDKNDVSVFFSKY